MENSLELLKWRELLSIRAVKVQALVVLASSVSKYFSYDQEPLEEYRMCERDKESRS